jgi:thymidylate synthase (FAD)
MEKIRVVNFYARNKYSKYKRITEDHFHIDHYITTNLRVIFENDRMEDLQYLCEPTEHHEKRITAKFICSRGVSHEAVRHRAFSFLQESQRYCMYSKERMGGEITYIIPSWMSDKQKNMSLETRDICGNTYAEVCFKSNLIKNEQTYFTLLAEGWKPQQARAVHPNSLKTELVMTGFVSDWEDFFKLRTSFIAATGAPHPQAAELANPLYLEFVDRKYINDLKG